MDFFNEFVERIEPIVGAAADNTNSGNNREGERGGEFVGVEEGVAFGEGNIKKGFEIATHSIFDYELDCVGKRVRKREREREKERKKPIPRIYK